MAAIYEQNKVSFCLSELWIHGQQVDGEMLGLRQVEFDDRGEDIYVKQLPWYIQRSR